MRVPVSWSRPLGMAALALACASPRATAQTETAAPPYPPPGRLVDVGGWRLHLNCVGESRPARPTVILEAGLGDFSVEWSLVQPGVARFARVCSYDRAGDGWSDMGPHPRTMRQIVFELHTLLERAGERPPFVLVGHSYGAWLVRGYQAAYPADVAALVLVEPGASDPLRLMPDGRLVHSSDLATGRPVPSVKTSGPLRESDIPPAALAQMRAGLAAASAGANAPPRDKLPPDAQRMRTWALGRIGHIVAAVNPFEPEELAELRARARGEHPLGDLPLFVVTRGLPDESGPDAERLEAEHRADHAAMAAMSRRGRLVIAARSGHHVQLDEPALVVGTIREAVEGTGR
ncbi:MAG: alpha/beta fold hydrolase [Gemmatimonadaceae bacterium]